MLEPEDVAFLHSGCALIVGLVDDDGLPCAGRGWGLRVVSMTTDETARPGVPLRLLLDASDQRLLDLVRPGASVAVTATSVETLRSLQLKGEVVDRVAVRQGDADCSSRYCDDFFGDIVATDHTDRELLERWRPRQVVPYELVAHEVFDQTPGPAAGSRVETLDSDVAEGHR